MPMFSKQRVMEEILGTGLVPVFYNGDVEIAKGVVKACSDGGARVIEFTNRGDRACDIFNELSRWCDVELQDVILGAGTIIDPSTAAQYMNASANFIVGPSFSPDVARVCNRRRVPYIPGCQTPTEISAAEEMGADIVKLFPASVLTPKFVKAVMGPSPRTQLMPSGGVQADQGDVTRWIEAGAVALNIGSELIRRDLMEDHRFEAIRENVEKCLAWIRQARENRA